MAWLGQATFGTWLFISRNKTLSKYENTYDQLQLKGLTNVILDSLPIDLNDVETVVINHISYIIQTNEKNEVPVLDTLQDIVGVAVEFSLESLKDFLLLYHGYKELREYGEQSFWEGLTLENKDRYIKDYFQKWIKIRNASVRKNSKSNQC